MGSCLSRVEAVAERLARDERHDVVEEAVGLAGIDQAQDVRMLQAGGDLDLGEEAIAADDGAQLGMEDLDGDLAAVLQVFGEIDRGHAALAQLALDAVAVAQRRGEATRGRRAQLRLRVRCRNSSPQFMTMMSCRSCSTGRTMTKPLPSGMTS